MLSIQKFKYDATHLSLPLSLIEASRLGSEMWIELLIEI